MIVFNIYVYKFFMIFLFLQRCSLFRVFSGGVGGKASGADPKGVEIFKHALKVGRKGPTGSQKNVGDFFVFVRGNDEIRFFLLLLGQSRGC